MDGGFVYMLPSKSVNTPADVPAFLHGEDPSRCQSAEGLINSGSLPAEFVSVDHAELKFATEVYAVPFQPMMFPPC